MKGYAEKLSAAEIDALAAHSLTFRQPGVRNDEAGPPTDGRRPRFALSY
jgi:hypothetical protein